MQLPVTHLMQPRRLLREVCDKDKPLFSADQNVSVHWPALSSVKAYSSTEMTSMVAQVQVLRALHSARTGHHYRKGQKTMKRMIAMLLLGVMKHPRVDLKSEKRPAHVERLQEPCGAGRQRRVRQSAVVGLPGDEDGGLGNEVSKGQYGVMTQATLAIVPKHSTKKT